MYLVMEFCAGGDLAHYIRRCKRVPEVAAHGLMLQLAAGLREMWSHNLVHVSCWLRSDMLGRCCLLHAALLCYSRPRTDADTVTHCACRGISSLRTCCCRTPRLALCSRSPTLGSPGICSRRCAGPFAMHLVMLLASCEGLLLKTIIQ